jgi:hypothetical protein
MGGGGYLLNVLIAPARRGRPYGVISLHLNTKVRYASRPLEKIS